MIFFDYLQKASLSDEKQKERIGLHKKEISSHLRILVLAIELQKWSRAIKCNKRSTAKRILPSRLATEYLESGFCSSEAAAYKMVKRDFKYLDLIFGITGDNKNGFGMRKEFNRYRDLLEYWMETLGEPKHSDRRMHVMLAGLLQTIDNGFRDHPIVVPELARELKRRFGNKNIRDSLQPLMEMFQHQIISLYLDLEEDEDGTLHIHDHADALLMRWRARTEVGGNADVSINLALPGQSYAIFNHHIKHLNTSNQQKAYHIANAVKESYIWTNDAEDTYVPYILYREGEAGPIILTLWQCSDGHYNDINIDEIISVPTHCRHRFIPFAMPPRLWERFQNLRT